jgi:zinc transporter, ZIP family
MIPELNPLLNILLLSFMASLGTGLGGLIAVIRRPGRRSYGLLMGITSGVMICLSFLELVNQAWELAGWLTATIGFGAGATFMFLLDHFAPHIRFGEKEIRGSKIIEPYVTPVEIHPGRHRHGWFRRQDHILDTKLVNTGLLLAVGITLHNLPEGIAVGAG